MNRTKKGEKKDEKRASRIILKQLAVFSTTVILLIVVAVLIMTMPINEEEADIVMSGGVCLRNDGDYWTVVRSSGGNRKILNIPEEYRGMPVKRIEKLIGNDEIAKLTIPKSVSYINVSALDTLTFLEWIEVDDDNHYYSSVDGVLYDSEKETLLKVPTSFDFGNKTFVVRQGVEAIGSKAFYGCRLTALKFSDSVKVVGAYAFKKCIRLAKIEDFENSKVLTLGDGCFEDCENLTGFVIPASIINIGEKCFNGCERITAFYVNEDNIVYNSYDGIIFSEDGTSLFYYAPGDKRMQLTVSEEVKVIEEYAFAANTDIVRIDLPSNIETVWLNAFIGCRSLAGVVMAADKPPETDIEIGDATPTMPFFVNEKYVYDYKLSKYWEDVNVYPLRMTGDFAWITVEEVRSYDVDRYLRLTDCGAKSSDGVIVTSFTEGVIDIPDYVSASGKTRSGSEGENAAVGLRKIVGSLKDAFISDNVTEIDFGNNYIYVDEDFAGFQNLALVTFGSNLIRINAGAFRGCTSLKRVVFRDCGLPLSRLSYIGESAFEGCTSLEFVELPALTSGEIILGASCFMSCPKLTTVIVHSKIGYQSLTRSVAKSEMLILVIPDELTEYYYTMQHYYMWNVERGVSIITMSEYELSY